MRRWALNTSAAQAADLQREADEESARHLCDCRAGELVTVYGTICSVTVRPQGSTRAFEAELYDGSGRVRLIWLGRQRIPGIAAGRTLIASGRLTAPSGESLTLFNPTYTLRPRSAE